MSKHLSEYLSSNNIELSYILRKYDKASLIESTAYNGNRFESRHFSYPPLLENSDDIGLDKPTIITDVPRLNMIQAKANCIYVRGMQPHHASVFFP